MCGGGSWAQNSSAGVNVATPLGQRLSANKLCHSYMAFNTNYCDTGLFGVSAVAQGGQHLEDLVWCIMQEFTGLVYRCALSRPASPRLPFPAMCVLASHLPSLSCRRRAAAADPQLEQPAPWGCAGQRCRAKVPVPCLQSDYS